jgi:hypothetical protein
MRNTLVGRRGEWSHRFTTSTPLTEDHVMITSMEWRSRAGLRLLAAAVLALALGATEARANQIFTLSSVTFSDGGTATGTFTTNDALNSLVTYNITTSGGTLGGFNYTPATTVSASTSLPSIIVVGTSDLVHLMEITFTGLTLTGSPIKIGQFDSFEQGVNNVHRQITAGSVVGAVTAIPEPASLALAGTAAIAGLGMGLWRRRRAR